MCDIFGYAGTRSPDAQLLALAAHRAGQRGPHGCGWAARSQTVPLYAVHHPGPLLPHLGEIRRIDATSVLGHARLATIGDWRQPAQLQPISAYGYALAHNGVIRNPDELAPGFPTDSIALAHAYATYRGEGAHPLTVLDKLVELADQKAWAIVALDTNGRLYAHRRYHPLFRYTDDRGTYLSSQRFHPEAQPVPEDTAVAI